jgi:hypothetical protein
MIKLKCIHSKRGKIAFSNASYNSKGVSMWLFFSLLFDVRKFSINILPFCAYLKWHKIKGKDRKEKKKIENFHNQYKVQFRIIVNGKQSFAIYIKTTNADLLCVCSLFFINSSLSFWNRTFKEFTGKFIITVFRVLISFDIWIRNKFGYFAIVQRSWENIIYSALIYGWVVTQGILRFFVFSKLFPNNISLSHLSPSWHSISFIQNKVKPINKGNYPPQES